MSLVGPFEILIILLVGLWSIGLPLLAIYFGVRMWQRLQQIEQTLNEVKAQITRRQ